MERRGHSALSRLLVRTYNDWRLAGLSNEPINPAALEVSTKADDLTLIFTTIGQRLVAARQVDYAGCIEGVIAAIQDKRLRLPPDLIVLLPESYPLTKRERDLLEILQQHGAQWHAFCNAARSERHIDRNNGVGNRVSRLVGRH